MNAAYQQKDAVQSGPEAAARILPRMPLVILFLLALQLAALPARGAQTVIYSTGFELADGFDTQFVLVGQGGWTNFGSGGNGILTNAFAGLGQQAYIGFAPPVGMSNLLNVWRPLNTGAAPATQSVVRFSVSMAVFSSSNGRHDDFRWSVYNTNGNRLFTLDFDAESLLISYSLDDGLGFRSTGFQFARDTLYDLLVTMNLGQNAWTATMGGVPIVGSQPVTTVGASRTIAEVDAIWAVRTGGSPGNNYLVFDNYSIIAEEPTVTTPTLNLLSFSTASNISFRLQGQQAVRYAIESSTNLANPTWFGIATNSSENGALDFNDPAPASMPLRFYRARQVP